jgi:hypothetical protein
VPRCHGEEVGRRLRGEGGRRRQVRGVGFGIGRCGLSMRADSMQGPRINQKYAAHRAKDGTASSSAIRVMDQDQRWLATRSSGAQLSWTRRKHKEREGVIGAQISTLRAGHEALRRAEAACVGVRLPALMDFYIYPLYVLVSKILSSILNSSAPIHPLYHPLFTLSTVGPTCHFI